jgi:hypothetical protein
MAHSGAMTGLLKALGLVLPQPDTRASAVGVGERRRLRALDGGQHVACLALGIVGIRDGFVWP